MFFFLIKTRENVSQKSCCYIVSLKIMIQGKIILEFLSFWNKYTTFKINHPLDRINLYKNNLLFPPPPSKKKKSLHLLSSIQLPIFSMNNFLLKNKELECIIFHVLDFQEFKITKEHSKFVLYCHCIALFVLHLITVTWTCE